jgi:VCBS repeat-containing protein
MTAAPSRGPGRHLHGPDQRYARRRPRRGEQRHDGRDYQPVAPSGENIDAADIGLSVNGSNQIVVTLGSDFQHLHDGESATFDVAYTLHGDQPGDTSTATLHVTVTGANDAPVAANVTFNGGNSAIGNTDLVVNDAADGAPTRPARRRPSAAACSASPPTSTVPARCRRRHIATANGGTVTMQADGDFTTSRRSDSPARIHSRTRPDQNPALPASAPAP